MSEAAALSKSAKKRAAKKARDGAADPPAEPVKEEPKPKASAKPKAKAEAKAEVKAPEPKAKAKVEPKAEAKPASKAASKKKEVKPEPKPEEEKKKEKEKEPASYVQMDDGTGGDWELATGQSKKQERRKQRQQEEKHEQKTSGEQQKVISAATASHNRNVVGAAPAKETASQLNAAKANQSVGATGAKAAEKVAATGDAKAATEEKKPAEKTETVSVKVGEQNIGKVIGPKGANLIKIKEKTGVTNINTEADVFIITGKPEDVKVAEAAIVELRDKGYMSLAYDNFKEDFVMAHPISFPDIIGSKGAIIRKLKEELSVEVSIPQGVSQNDKRKHKISIAGASEATAKAKKVIEDIIMYYHHEITHPGLTHAELEVPPWAYSFIIGKQGSELRHIQKNWNVKMSIPREYSENQNVVVVGEPRDVESAKKYVEKLVHNAENYSTGRDKAEKADDGWGDEGEDEPWMKQYMYQRR